MLKHLLTIAFITSAIGITGQSNVVQITPIEKVHEGAFQVRDTSFNTIIDMAYGIEKLVDGHIWSEGPLWLEEEGILIYNDIPRNTTYAWSEDNGVYEYLNPSGYTGDDEFTGGEPGANGMALDSKGRLVMCQHGDRRVAMMTSAVNEPESRFKTIAGKFNGKRLNSPNDLVVHSSGAIFFTDPPYGLPGQVDDPAKEIEYQGVYRVSPDGTVYLLSKSFTRPNGIALSPDEKTLYVANSDPDAAYWQKFDVTKDLSLENEMVFADVTDQVGEYPGLPDGLKVDSNGIIYASGPGGIFVFTPDGKELGRVMTGQATSNCALDAAEEYLYITADMFLMRVKLN